MTKLTPHEQHLFNEAKAVAQTFNACELKLINSLQFAEELKYYLKLEYTSLYDFAHKELKLTEAVSYNLIAIARKSIKVPELKMAIETGELTVSNAKLLTSVITPDNKKHWIGLASGMPKPKLEKEIVKVSPKALVQDRAQYLQEDVIKLTGSICEETHKILKRVQDLESQRTGKPASLDDALKAMGLSYLKAHDPVEKAKRARQREESSNSSSGRVDQKQTEIPFFRTPLRAKQQHELTLRNQGQCFHISSTGQRCENRRWLQTHHIISIANGGTNRTENLVTLCRAHHKMRHGSINSAIEGKFRSES